MKYFVVVNGPLKQARIVFDNRAQADELAKRICQSRFTAWVEDEQTAERATAPMHKPQPKTPKVDGWDV